LVLECAFPTAAKPAARLYPLLPVQWLLTERYPSVTRLPSVVCPVLCLHGAKDELIPLEMGRELFAAAPDRSVTGPPGGLEKRFVALNIARHNDIMTVARGDYELELYAFLDVAVPAAAASAGTSAEPRKQSAR
jgi:fermentation-respiration switch protein FrsA (DUF1100 family)